jgi:uncharacterized membrane protein
MRTQLLKYWDRLRSSFWFLPGMLAAAATLLALASVELDRTATDRWLDRLGWVYGGGAEGAAAVLETIAGSMMTIAGVVFSMTLVALTLASSQFGPRLLRNFMRDTSNQLVLGAFVAAFLYALLVLRTIRRGDEDLFVPQLSVTIALMLALLAIGVLIYFIHHVSVSIQADEIVARVGEELDGCIDRLYPAQPQPMPAARDAVAAGDLASFFRIEEARAVPAPTDGYLQYLDESLLLEQADECDLIIRQLRRAGEYVARDRPLLLVFPAERATDHTIEQLSAAMIVGNQRTPAQDVEFGMSQLIEIAVRALSPGINDPFTALRCIDRLGTAFYRLVQRPMPSPLRFAGDHRLRIIFKPVSFAEMLGDASNQIRQHAVSSLAVSKRMLEVLGEIAEVAGRAEDRAAIRLHAQLIADGALRIFSDACDRESLQERYQTVLRQTGGAKVRSA